MTARNLRGAGSSAPDVCIDRIAATAIEAARRAGEIQLRHFRNPGRMRATGTVHDVKLDTDCLCEAAIVAAIRERFADHAILSEEGGGLPGRGAYTWIVDPLDGTVNFWHGLPFFCVSIACYSAPSRWPDGPDAAAAMGGKPLVGVIFLPYSGELFVGIEGRGAFLNDRPIRVSAAVRPREMVVTVSFGKKPEVMQRMTRRLDALLPRVRKARCLGAAAAELAYSASGFLGGVFYEGLKPWDFAAGKILLEQAGGFFQAIENEAGRWQVVGGAPAIRDSLAALAAR
jgi:myo-inositol-1(or 4)-monophosphatase